MSVIETPRRSRGDVLKELHVPLDHDLVCKWCHEFRVVAGETSPKNKISAHERICLSNPDRSKTQDELRETEWPQRVARGERIPLDQVSPMKAKQEMLRVFLETLVDLGGDVVGTTKNPRRSATSIVQEALPEKYRHNTANTWQLLRDSGWITAPVNGRYVPRVTLNGVLPWYTPQTSLTPVVETVAPVAETVSAETVVPPAEAQSSPSTAALVASPLVATGDDGLQDELGGRGGRLAARLERTVPDQVAATVLAAMRADRDAQYAALGYWPTVDPETLAKLRKFVEDADTREARMQSVIEDLNERLQRTDAMLDFLQDDVDASRVKTNDYTPSSKAMSVNKVPEHYRPTAKLAIQQGWSIQHTRGGHLAWTSPDGKKTFSGGSPNRNSINVLRKKLRRLGLTGIGSNEVADVTQSGQVL